jgi:hypothetical protein
VPAAADHVPAADLDRLQDRAADLGPEWFDGGEVNPWPQRVYTNGIYDPATDSWRRPAPRPDDLQAGYGGQFVWTGREVLLWGSGGGVAYDPSADTWRAMAEAPFTREFPSHTWTGAERLVWGGTTGQDCADGCPAPTGWPTGLAKADRCRYRGYCQS